MELYIIRHGETVWNKEERLQGRSDIELNEKGTELARITSKALEGIHFDRIYSSPLKRAYKTAEIIKGSRKTGIITDDRLLEMCFGDYEGKSIKTLPEEFRNFFDDPVSFIPAKHGETYKDIISRASSFIHDIVVPASESCERMLIVAHGALIKALMLTMDNLEIKDYWSGIFPKNCSVSIYKVAGNNFRCIQDSRIYY